MYKCTYIVFPLYHSWRLPHKGSCKQQDNTFCAIACLRNTSQTFPYLPPGTLTVDVIRVMFNEAAARAWELSLCHPVNCPDCQFTFVSVPRLPQAFGKRKRLSPVREADCGRSKVILRWANSTRKGSRRPASETAGHIGGRPNAMTKHFYPQDRPQPHGFSPGTAGLFYCSLGSTISWHRVVSSVVPKSAWPPFPFTWAVPSFCGRGIAEQQHY